jgi:Universal stress protein family
VNPPKENEESPVMPLGAPTEITVYDRVVVGSDGTPTSLKTVRHAGAVAVAADARLVVVSAYTPESGANTTATGKRLPGVRQLLYGEEAARAALRTSINELSNERVRNTETRIVEGGPGACATSRTRRESSPPSSAFARTGWRGSSRAPGGPAKGRSRPTRSPAACATSCCHFSARWALRTPSGSTRTGWTGTRR